MPSQNWQKSKRKSFKLSSIPSHTCGISALTNPKDSFGSAKLYFLAKILGLCFFSNKQINYIVYLSYGKLNKIIKLNEYSWLYFSVTLKRSHIRILFINIFYFINNLFYHGIVFLNNFYLLVSTFMSFEILRSLDLRIIFLVFFL